MLNMSVRGYSYVGYYLMQVLYEIYTNNKDRPTSCEI